ncbi:MAG: hypothetical protein ACRDRV_07040 [Pseudonocardiaceae bacterium]
MPRPEPSRSRVVGSVTVLCRVVLVACNVVTTYTTLSALLIDEPDIEDASIMAGFGALFAAVTGFLTLTVVRLVGAPWLIVPALVFAVAFARGLYLDTVYPPPPG